LAWKPEVKTLFETATRRWEDNIEMDCEDVGWEGVDWIDLAQDGEKLREVVKMAINFWASEMWKIS
jgi:hypothetical protein